MLTLTNVLIEFDNQSFTIEAGKRLSVEELYADFNIVKAEDYQRINLTLHPKQGIVLKNIELQFKGHYQAGDRIFCNGFQSWSESKEYGLDEKIPRLQTLARPYLRYYGDEYIPGINKKAGTLHSWTYSYVRQGAQIELVGSMLDRTGFTLIQHDIKNQLLRVRKDCEHLELKHSYPVFDLLVMKGPEEKVFDTYFQLMECPRPVAPPVTGWTSWYNYYTDISETLLLKNLEAITEQEIPFGVFQIDDGYQTFVGDWLSVKNTFPNGMGYIAQQIKSKGMKPGLWLAPFVCDKRSTLYKNHQNWLLKDKQGKPIKVGYNPAWGGWYFALDYYQPGVQEYLTQVFYEVLHKWGFGLVKLDFLFAACIHPPAQKTRGQVMHEVMDFLRRLVGDRLILGCGVPLASAFGLVDYCRIGADIHLKWEHRFLKFLGMRERVSTIVALRTVLGRWQLNGRAFHNDPDVFLLRENNIDLNPRQQYTVLLINVLLGNLLFTSDYVGDYSEEQKAEMAEVFQWEGREVLGLIHRGNDRYVIFFRHSGQEYVAAINLNAEAGQVDVGMRNAVELEGFESLVLKRALNQS